MGFLYSGEDLPQVFSSEKFDLFLKLDSKNKVFKLKYRSDETDLYSYYDQISFALVDQHIDHLEKLLTSLMKSDQSNYHLEISALRFYNALTQFLEKQKVTYDSNEILCRCNSITLGEFESEVISFKGSETELKKNTNVAMICTSCDNAFKLHLNEFSRKHNLYMGHNVSQLLAEINQLLESEFPLISPEQFHEVKILCVDIAAPNIYLKLENIPNDFDSDQAKSTLNNYLSRELQLACELELITDN